MAQFGHPHGSSGGGDARILGQSRDVAISAPADLDRIRAYYDETWLDYRFLWLNPRNYAIHFGYWDSDTTSHEAALLNMNRVLAERAGVQAGQRILDAGCGVGGSAIWLARTYDVEVVGIAPVRSQIERARHFAASAGVDRRVGFEQGDYLATGFPSESFDVVWALESVCHAADKRGFLLEARRLLRPGGRLVMAEYLRRSRPLAPAGEALLQSWLSGWAIPDLALADEFRDWAQASGFGPMDVTDVTSNVEPSLRRLHRMARLSWPLAVAFHAIGLRSGTQHGNTRGARDQYRALQRGLWYYGLLSATAA
jgi:cyclopropane fatty-acyl-phospholipid synthase-like methyltransferase